MKDNVVLLEGSVVENLPNTLFRVKLADSESGFRALSRRAVAELTLTEKGFAIETEMIAEAAAKGLRITEIPVANVYIADGSTQNPVRHGLGVLFRIAVMMMKKLGRRTKSG